MSKTLFPDLRTANVDLEVNVVSYIDLERVSDLLVLLNIFRPMLIFCLEHFLGWGSILEVGWFVNEPHK